MQTVVPQMMRWLPQEEAEQTKRAFADALQTETGSCTRARSSRA
jgi:hypothetical protein